MVLLVSPAAKLTVPVGKAAPVKSAAFAGLALLPVTAKAAVEAPVVLPVRVTVKVKAVLPLLPSFRLALTAAIDSDGPTAASSLTMVPVAVAVPMVVPELGFDRVTLNPSLGSTVVSAATFTVMVLLVSPAAKLTVPVGKAAPVKSAAFAGLAPLPVTAKAAVDAPAVLPVRVTVKVKAVLPLLPSFRLAFAAAIDSDGPTAPSSLTMVPVAVAVPMVVPELGFDRVTLNPSLGSTVVSGATFTVMVLLVSPAAKLTVPVG